MIYKGRTTVTVLFTENGKFKNQKNITVLKSL